MKRTTVLFQQHIGRMFRAHWKVQGKRILVDNGALKELKLKGIVFEDANEFIRDKEDLQPPQISDCLPEKVALDKSHPDYHDEVCLKYSDNNVLLGGLDQAKVFTNSCEMEMDMLPFNDKLKNTTVESFQDNLAIRCIKSSLLYDATQEKLPKRKDPERPAFVFPRDYGITDRRKNFLLGKRLLQLCSSLSPELLDKRRLVEGPVNFQVGIRRNDKDVLLSNVADVLVTADVNVKPISNAVLHDLPLPDIYPLSPLISLEQHHIYKFEEFFPMSEKGKKQQVHTILIHFDKNEVTNIFETEVTETQIMSRSLMKCYTVALAQAKHNFGEDVLDLPEPIVVQCVQMDSKRFHFSVLQLNTIGGPNDTSIRNAYWNLPLLSLYEYCDYNDGRPEIIGYNPAVFQTLLTFYQHR